ncbi:MAG TPA: mechanosensitive ion channel domain-containing protein [Candidatus Limnocylindria bacterium]
MLPEILADAAPKVVIIILSAVAAFIAIRIAVNAAVRQLIERRAGDIDTGNLKRVELERRITTLGQLVVKIAAGVIVVMAALMVLGVFNVDIGPAIAALGIAGLAVGFGAQTLIKDWLSGIFIVAENQFNAGEQVRIAGVEGEVEDFSLRRTVLRDADGTVHHVPNGQIIVASNLSRGRHAPQARLGFGASTGAAGAAKDEAAPEEEEKAGSA